MLRKNRVIKSSQFEYERGPVFNQSFKQGSFSPAAYGSLKTPFMHHFSGVIAFFYYKRKASKRS